MSTYEWLLFGHIFSAFMLLAAAGVSTAVGITVGRLREPTTMIVLLDMQRYAEWFVTTPFAIAAAVLGTLLVNELDYSFDAAWIGGAYTLIVVALGLDHGFLLRANRRTRALAVRVAVGGPATGSGDLDALHRATNSPLTMAVGVLLDLVFVAFLALMVFKPGQ